MKNLVSLIMLLSIMLIGATTAFADYPKYLGGDRNYIFFDGHQGIGRYVDKKSLNVEWYKPPRYIIAIDCVSVPDADRDATAINGRYRERFNYDWARGIIYRINDGTLKGIAGKWWDSTEVSRAKDGAFAPAAEIAFGLAYNMKFLEIYPADFYDFMK
ncbi:MAG: hypothetical protein IJ862_01170 [Selenomonadaceae bacterium]|nr:hypothetical protein [Selenomonadaceae bacterium]